MQHRVISLIASATEIVAALGYGDALVGRSHECDFPPEVERLTICSEPRIDVSGNSLEIDVAVKEAVREALSVYAVFKEELERLRPTLIVTQTQCDVCAVNLREVEAAVCELVDSQPQIVACQPMALDDIWADIHNVAEALGDPTAGELLINSLQTRLAKLKQECEACDTRPKVACIEWLEPLMMAGNWIPELVEIAGGEAILATAGEHSPYLTWEDLVQANPDVIAMMPCGFDIPRTLAELQLLTKHSQWANLNAVKTGRVYVTDGNQFFNRPGPRVVESAEILTEILHQRRPYKHQGSGWLRIDEATSMLP